ncbi:hypothetical protein BpHYR1_001978 [Brachionus plicatilis]|uniref:Uncharacterized protein n=1 Tax=Brachionus plicatilis TaxID=10195 RepID=A0A3M7PLT3_BRAPC|nr:hypothetical protein BpHYR1_001978 [Brachionus plicatilis]
MQLKLFEEHVTALPVGLCQPGPQLRAKVQKRKRKSWLDTQQWKKQTESNATSQTSFNFGVNELNKKQERKRKSMQTII